MKRCTATDQHDSSHNKANGHAGTDASGLTSCGAALLHGHSDLGKAGSDDASEFSAANAASASSTAGADRKATADLAESAAEGRPRAAGTALGGEANPPTHPQPLTAAPARDAKGHAKSAAEPGTRNEKENRFAAVPPGRKALPVDGEAFVNAVHRQVDLVQLEVTLLRDEDQKIVQRELAYLRELRYGKRAPITEEETTHTVIFDAPRPKRD